MRDLALDMSAQSLRNGFCLSERAQIRRPDVRKDFRCGFRRCVAYRKSASATFGTDVQRRLRQNAGTTARGNLSRASSFNTWASVRRGFSTAGSTTWAFPSRISAARILAEACRASAIFCPRVTWGSRAIKCSSAPRCKSGAVVAACESFIRSIR